MRRNGRKSAMSGLEEMPAVEVTGSEASIHIPTLFWSAAVVPSRHDPALS
jgi:hypothetical protein